MRTKRTTRTNKNKLLLGLVSVFSFFLFKTGMAQAPLADFGISPPSICAGAIVQVSDLSTGLPTSWSYTLNGTPSISSAQNPTVTFTSAGIYTLSLVATNGSGPSALVSKTISVNAPPALSLSGNNAVCIGASITETVSGADTYTWSSGSLTDVEIFSPSASANFTVTGTNTLTGCSDSKTLAITVNPLPVLSVSGNSVVCFGASVTQTVSGADVYLWNEGSNSNIVALSPTLATTYTVVGTNTTTGCFDSGTVAIAVNQLPVLTIAGDNTVCANSAITQTVSGADTYLWTNNGATSNTVTFNPASSIIFSVTGTNTLTGCSDVATVSVTALALPSLTLSGNNTMCAGASVTQTVSGADNYSWSTGAVTDNEMFSPPSSTSYTVTGTSTLTGCSNAETVSITVNALPILAVSGSSAVCIGSSVTQTISGADAYVWSNGANSNIVALSPTVATTYTVAGTNSLTGCSDSITVAVIVNALPVLTITGDNTVCANSAITQTVTGADTYLWINTGATSGIVNFNPASSTIYSVTGTNTLTGCSDVATVSINALALPSLTLSGNNSFCLGASATQTVSGADTYSWSTGTITDNETFSPPTSTVYTVTGTNTLSSCFSVMSVSITVNAIPTVSVNSGAICTGLVFTMTPSGASTYTYSNGSATVIPTSNFTYSVTGTSSAGCVSSNTAVASVTLNSLPTVTVNSGALCAGQVFTMTAGGASTYTYSNGSATVIPSSNSNYSVTGTSAAGCTSSNTAIASITVNALPTLTVNSGAICVGGTFTIVPGGALTYTISGGSAIVSPVASLSYSISGTSPEGCLSSNMAVSNVTVNALPSILILGNSTICAGAPSNLIASGATTYTWSNTVINSSITVSPNTSTTYSLTGTDNNGCSNSASQLVTVNPLPTVTVNNGSICQGGSFILIPGGANSYTYQGGSNTVTPASTTTYSVLGMDGLGCVSAAPAIATITVVSTVTVTVSGATSICSGSSAFLTAGGAPTYSWSTGIATSSIALNPLVNTTYTVTGIDGPCSTATIVSIIVNALPTISVSTSNALICSGESVSLTANGATTYTWNTTQNGNALVVTPLSNTSYTVNGTDVNGCTNMTTITQNVSDCTGINAQSAEMTNVNIYPNPNNGEFVLDVEQDLSVTIMNSTGQIISENKLQKGSNQINMKDQASGIYLIMITQGNYARTLKVIKN